MLKKKHVLTLAKLVVGALVVWFIAKQLTFDDQITVAGPEGAQTFRGRELEISPEAEIRYQTGGVWNTFPLNRAAVFKNKDGSYYLEVRGSKGVERIAASAVEFWKGKATMKDDSGRLISKPIKSLKVNEEGKDPARLSPAFKVGLRSILGRLDDKPMYAIGAIACMIMAYLTAILRWRMLLHTQGLDVTYGRALKLTFIGFFFNNVLPGLTGGDIVKAVMIAQDHPEQRPAAVGTVIVDRVLGIIVLALMSAAVLVFRWDVYPEAAIAVFGFLGAAGVALILLFSRRVRSAIKLDELVKKLPGASIMKKLDRAFFLYRSQKRIMLEATIISLVSHCGNIGAILCFGLGIGLDETAGLEGNPVVAYLATVPIILIVSSLPVLPGGWGVGEAAFAYFFRTVGIWNFDLSIALSLVQRTATLLFSLLGGVFFLTHRKRVMDAVHAGEEAPGAA